MFFFRSHLTALIKQIALVFLFYTICRILFFSFNHDYFQDVSFFEFLSFLGYGLRFDAFSISATNALYILMCSIPFKLYYSKPYQNIVSAIFIITNSIGLLLNFIDFGYFSFTQKRLAFDVLFFVFGGQTDFLRLIPHFMNDFWYLVLLYVFIVTVFVIIHFKIKRSEVYTSVNDGFKKIWKDVFVFVFLQILVVIAFRGGLQKIPIGLIDAASTLNPKYSPIISNSTFSFLKSMELIQLNHRNTFSEEDLRKYYNPIHPPDSGIFNRYNVCVIILESFSKEFTGVGNRKSYTPFFDSLMNCSLVFDNAIANAKSSINGIPAIIASLPSFLENPYLNSVYSNNTLQTLPNLLKTKGYYSVFFHGGTNGTMNFDSFSKIAGYDSYYGRTEYDNDNDYDGQWGIWDEPFLKKTVVEMSKMKQPFFTSVFTLSSHHPYKIPEKYYGKFPKTNRDIIESIGYTDYALKQFFYDASKQPWFNNTLFVLCPDHTADSKDVFYSNFVGQYSIPIVFYKKGILPKKESKTVQQIDILPTVLDLLNYDQPFYSFGKSMIQNNEQPAFFYKGSHFYCVLDSFCYIMHDTYFIHKYNFKKDSLLSHNLIDSHKENGIVNYCNAFIQCYTNDLIDNKTAVSPTK